MFAANHLRKQNPVILRGTPITPSQALKYAWWFEAFRKKLATGVWRFSYFKKDGSIQTPEVFVKCSGRQAGELRHFPLLRPRCRRMALFPPR